MEQKTANRIVRIICVTVVLCCAMFSGCTTFAKKQRAIVKVAAITAGLHQEMVKKDGYAPLTIWVK